jgi:hypothetical protein
VTARAHAHDVDVETIAWIDPSGAGPRLTFQPVEVALPTGHRLMVREMIDEDAQGIWLLYEGLNADDRYRRFFALSHPSHAFAESWVRGCRANGAGLVAVVDVDGVQVVAEAGYVLVPNGNGELGLTVAAEWRGWLGPYLVELIVGLAAAHGVRNLEADVLVENRSMLAVLHHRPHATLGDGDFNVEHVVIGASDKRPGWPPIRTHPRVLVEGRGARGPTARELERAGFEMMGCAGPGARGVRCPALKGEPCALAAGAGAIVVALPAGANASGLVAAHRRLVPGIPLVVKVSAGDAVARPAAVGEERRLPEGASSAQLVGALRGLLDRPRSSSDEAHVAGTFDPRSPGPDSATTAS